MLIPCFRLEWHFTQPVMQYKNLSDLRPSIVSQPQWSIMASQPSCLSSCLLLESRCTPLARFMLLWVDWHPPTWHLSCHRFPICVHSAHRGYVNLLLMNVFLCCRPPIRNKHPSPHGGSMWHPSFSYCLDPWSCFSPPLVHSSNSCIRIVAVKFMFIVHTK